MRGTKKPDALPVRSAMNTARPVPSTPPIAFVDRLAPDQPLDHTATTTEMPTATAAAVFEARRSR